MGKQDRPDRGGSGNGDPPRLIRALAAGVVAIGANTGLLAAADAVGLVTAHGGLLRLLQSAARWSVSVLDRSVSPTSAPFSAPPGPAFQAAFHVVVGLAMAVFYAYAVEPLLSGSPWRKGFFYALLVWLANAFLVLPLIGEGIAGSRHLGTAGIIGFAVIHTVFFLLLALLYGRTRGC
jgi:hypothetical protein